jgi:uncharacterized membrane protein
MRASAYLAPVLIASGVSVVAASVLLGAARVAVVVVIPVVYGGSALFLIGVLLLIAGIFTLPFSFEGPSAGSDDPPPVGSGGLVLIGPVPLFWGSARGVSRRVRIAAAIAGAVLLVVVIALVVVRIR